MNAPVLRPFGPLHGRIAALPPFPGKMRAIDGAAGLRRWFGGSEQQVCLWPGARFTVDLRDRIQRQMWLGCYEPHVSRCLHSILRPGDTFVDVGAHIGYHSYFAAGIVGAAGRVFSFEPDPALFARLQKNLEPFSHAHAFHGAVWQNEGELHFERSASATESGWGTLANVRDLGKGEHILVRTTSLDAWSVQAGVDAIRAIKIDAEGSEPAVLCGAQKALHRMQPALLFEVNTSLLKQASSSPEAVEEILHSNCYKIYGLAFHRIERLASLSKCEFGDCVALPDEQAEALLARLKGYGFKG